MIQVQNLEKWYGPTLAVDRVSFEIPKGEVVGFLGPNGAGKSTTLRILTGYIPPTSGLATIDGRDILSAPDEARASLGYLPEGNPLYPEMRVEEFLHYRGRLFQMSGREIRKRIDELVDRCGLSLVRRRLIGQLSRGNKQRVGLAQALLHDPPVLILDEPTSGLDPNQVAHFRTLLDELKGKHTILLSTHILPEVEKTADRVIIIAGGKIVAQGTPDELRRNVASGSRVLVEVKAGAEEVRSALLAGGAAASVETRSNDGWCTALVTPGGKSDIREQLGKAVAGKGWIIREMRYETASLEQFFVQITARQTQSKEPHAA